MKFETYIKSQTLLIFEKYHDDIPDKNQGGECYQNALTYMMTNPRNKNLRLCHGLVTGQGDIEGIVYTHAWVENGNKVIDKTINVELDKRLYYAIGNIKKNDVYSYTHQEMSENVRNFKTYGPWEKKLLNNKY